MLEAVRLSLRLTVNDFDTEILDLIEACKMDLKVAGVVKIVDNDPLILRAVTMYAQGHFGGADIGEKYLKAYEYLKITLCMSSHYRVAESEAEADRDGINGGDGDI